MFIEDFKSDFVCQSNVFLLQLVNFMKKYRFPESEIIDHSFLLMKWMRLK